MDEIIKSDAPNVQSPLPSVQAVKSKNSFTHQSPEVQEILSRQPPRIIRWGISLFALLLLFIFYICWLIPYPEIIVAKARLNSLNAPKQIVARSEGKLIKILVKEHDEVIQNQVIGYTESFAKPSTIKSLSVKIDSIQGLLYTSQPDFIKNYINVQNNAILADSLGELQSNYQTFVNAYISYRDYLPSGFYTKKLSMLHEDQKYLIKQNEILLKQKDLAVQDLALTEKTFDVNESLENQKVISKLDLRNEKSKLINKQMSIPQLNASIIANESQQHEKTKEIADLENQILSKKTVFLQAIETLKSQIQAWEYKYLLKAPISGKISFLSFLQENQEIKMGQPLFSIHPDDIQYYIEMWISQYNFGKVRPNQSVLLKFQAYPYEQFGTVSGRIESINPNPSDSGYFAKVILPYGLITNNKHEVLYQNGLAAEADILVDNMRLLQKFYYNLTKQFRRT